MTYTTTYPTRRSQSGGVFVFIILVLFAFIGYAAINVIIGNHAMESHPDTAPITRDCIQRNGVWKAYQEKEPNDNTFHWLCQDPVTKTIYDMIVEKIDEFTYREKTAFIRKDGKWTQVDNWLRPKVGQYIEPPQGPFNLIPPP